MNEGNRYLCVGLSVYSVTVPAECTGERKNRKWLAEIKRLEEGEWDII